MYGAKTLSCAFVRLKVLLFSLEIATVPNVPPKTLGPFSENSAPLPGAWLPPTPVKVACPIQVNVKEGAPGGGGGGVGGAARHPPPYLCYPLPPLGPDGPRIPPTLTPPPPRRHPRRFLPRRNGPQPCYSP